MPSTLTATLREAHDHVILERTDAHWEVDPRGTAKEQQDALAGTIGDVRVYSLRFEIMGTLERLAKAGLVPGKIFLPEIKEMTLPPVTVAVGNATNIGELRIKVTYDRAAG